ncbi:MAG TPA: class I SAM-dependent methyltransferase [Bacteroidia bacterium]
MKWIFKAIVQKGISFLPFGQKVNFLFQKYVTRGVYLSDQYFEDRLNHCREHFRNFKKYNSTANFSHLELGTGWYPVVPTGMFLYGAGSITTVDIARLCNEERTHVTLRKFVEYHQNGKLKKFLPGISEERLNTLLEEAKHPTFDYYAMLEKHNIVYMVMDARKLHLADGSIDLITSNNTFEHIYAEILKGILTEFKRIARPGGVMSHSIDMSDHFAHFDNSISVYNFLQYSDTQWRWIDNCIQPQNRMRIYDFRNLYKNLFIPLSEEINLEPNLDEYRKVKVDPKFLDHPETENAVCYSCLVSVM